MKISPVDGALPRTGDQQDTNEAAKQCFIAGKPISWRVGAMDGDTDFGLDFHVQMTRDQQATHVFRAQLKGTRARIASTDGLYLSIPFKATTIRYYDRMSEPVLLVVCDMSGGGDPGAYPLRYVWLREELERIGVADLSPEREWVTLRVPTTRDLRDADLTADVERFSELARLGPFLDAYVEEARPGMADEERHVLVKSMVEGLVACSPAMLDALAAPAEDFWIDPKEGSLAWRLLRARKASSSASKSFGVEELDAAAAMLEDAPPLELAEYWLLRAQLLTRVGEEQAARAAHGKARDARPSGRYLAAWAVAEIRARGAPGVYADYADLLAALQGDESIVLSTRSRILAVQGRYGDAIAVADRIEGNERFSARALVHTLVAKPSEALADCDAGIAAAPLADNDLQLLLILRARALFALAIDSVPGHDAEVLPPSGLAGVDPVKLKLAWLSIVDAVAALRDAGWPPNVEFISDIWAITASALGRNAEALPAVAEVARARQHLSGMQMALESIAAQSGEFALALEANLRMEPSAVRDLRRALLLHEAGRHSECVDWFGALAPATLKAHPLFGPASVMACLSAEKLARSHLIAEWSSILDAEPALREHAAMLRFQLASERDASGRDAALAALVRDYDKLGQPFELGVGLMQELDPTDRAQADILLRVAAKARERIEPSRAMGLHIAMAMVTTQRWAELIELCAVLKTRLDADTRMLAYEAFALDREGRADEARRILERLLADDAADFLAMNTYIAIMARCGYTQEAAAVAERALGLAKTKPAKIFYVRALFNLIQASDASSPRLLPLSSRMAELADPAREHEEAAFLRMFVTAVVAGKNTPSSSDAERYARRSSEFFAKYPQSKLMRLATVQPDATAQDLLSQLRAMTGVTDEREAFQRKVTEGIRTGSALVPFAWRPRRVLPMVHDVPQLWELGKASGRDERELHLTMVDATWEPRSVAYLRGRVPLLDITALLVLHNLGMIAGAVRFFGRIAIAKSTLEALAELVSPFSGSAMQARCQELQNAIKPHLAAIEQPSAIAEPSVAGPPVAVDDMLDSEQRDIASLCRQDRSPYRLYSDDQWFRVLCARSDSPDGVCTLDVLHALLEVGGMDRTEVARAIAKLCSWRVGVAVRLEELDALLPKDFQDEESVESALGTLEGDPDFMAVSSEMWAVERPFLDALALDATTFRHWADDSEMLSIPFAALLRSWMARASVRGGAPPSRLGCLRRVLVVAALPDSATVETAAKLWSAYALIVECEDEANGDARDASWISQLGRECAHLRAWSEPASERAFAVLRAGLAHGGDEESEFAEAYASAAMDVGMDDANPSVDP